jgi:hypothetical protein
MGFWRFLGGGILLCLACGIVYYRDGWRWVSLACVFMAIAAVLWVAGRDDSEAQDSNYRPMFQHHLKIVPQKYLTTYI